MTPGTGQRPADQAPRIHRVAIETEPAGEKTLLLLGAEQPIAQQVERVRKSREFPRPETAPSSGDT